LVRDTVASGGSVLFIGTKRQAQETIEAEAVRCGMPFVNVRWLGGTLTNWRTIYSRIEELGNLERARDSGEFEKLTKKEALGQTRKMERLAARLGGLRVMHALPGLLFVVDVRREETSIHEANLLKLPVLALVDTNCDPAGVDYVIPSNDDAIRAIKLLTAKIADAVLEGKALRKDLPEAEAEGMLDEDRRRQAAEEPDKTDEELLGEATLAKLQSGAFDEDLMAKFIQAAEAAEVVAPKDGEKEPVAPPEKEPEAPPAEES
jgi:small subunit ribosomal protein S2